MFFAASMAIIFAFFYQVNTVEGRGRSSGRGGWGGGSSRGRGWGGRSSSRGNRKGSSIGGGYYKKKGYLSCVYHFNGEKHTLVVLIEFDVLNTECFF